uniref:Paired amphipathic helix protein Sin3 n=1 Tax=Cajanus cajan TaxID=3821 RepID=A0A151QTY6_CAJCA|nr:Paired amphipathic helix protein Sin3 [Cajanus cajan]
MTRGVSQKQATDDALAYLKAVKYMFQDKGEKYDDFLEVMKDFKFQRIDITGVTTRVKELFKGKKDLILGFNTFLPKGHEITLSLEDEHPPQKKPVEFEEAINFVGKIKTRFQGNDHVCKSFYDILNMYRKETKPISEVYQEKGVHLTIQGQDHVYESFLAVLRMFRIGNKTLTTAYKEITELLQNSVDLLNGLSRLSINTSKTDSIHIVHGQNSVFRERSSAVPKGKQGHARKRKLTKTTYDDHQYSVDDRSDRDWSEGEKENRIYYQDGIQRLVLKGSSSCMAEDPRAEPFCNADKIFGMDPMSSTCYHKTSMKSSEEFLVCAKGNEKLQNHKNCFSKNVDVQSKEKTTQQKLQSSVKHGPKRLKVEDWDKERHHDSDDRVKEMIGECRKWDKSSAVVNKNVSGPKLSLYANKKNYSAKSVMELDVSICEQGTPSYYLLPKEFQTPSSSQRTKFDAEVLNDHWICVNSRTKDSSFKHKSINPYEKILFKCEDDRFELDMVIEIAKSTTKQVKELIEKITTNIIESDNPINIEVSMLLSYINSLNLRCIERLYGDHGLEVIDELKKNASLVLPVILTRLKQKQDEWARCRADFHEVWAEICAKNYHKSLDPHTTYSKKQDTKCLSTIGKRMCCPTRTWNAIFFFLFVL